MSLLLSRHTRRREVLAGLAACAVASPSFTAAAQQSPAPSRRIGVQIPPRIDTVLTGHRRTVGHVASDVTGAQHPRSAAWLVIK